MEKNWLIRTKNKHIIGPISREKVLELLENSSIKGEDEVCSGNGFWFFIKETDLVNKYLVNGEQQPFNPVWEDDEQPVKKNEGSVQMNQNELEEEIKFPDEEDLDYPDEEALTPTEDDLEYPSVD